MGQVLEVCPRARRSWRRDETAKTSRCILLGPHIHTQKFSNFGKENLEQLRCCALGECYKLQVLIDFEDFKEEGDGITLTSLEYLCLLYEELGDHLEGPVQKGSLSCLKSLTLQSCPRVIRIFTRELLENLSSRLTTVPDW